MTNKRPVINSQINISILATAAAMLILTPTTAGATSGRTDAKGCHNSKSAGYHCHGAKSAPTKTTKAKKK